MLSNVNYEVTFRVHVRTELGEIVCLTGDCEELGNWEPQKGVKLSRETKNGPVSNGIAVNNGYGCSADEEVNRGDVWSKKMKFSGQMKRKYRFFVCRLFHSDNEDEENSVIVTRWETNILPRHFSLSDLDKNEGKESEIATFGEYDGKCHVTAGWLMDQSQINIDLHDQPIKMWNSKYRQQTYSIKCTPINHGEHIDEDDDHVAHNTVVTVSILKSGESRPVLQPQYGVLCQNGFMTFMVQTLDPEHTGYKFDYYIHEDTDTTATPRHVGYSYILPVEMNGSVANKTAPITSLKHKPLGQVKFDYLLIKPLMGLQQRLKMDVSYQNYWKYERQPLEIGHRGMGMSYSHKCKHLAGVRENTVKSLNDAASHGADYVEFDVHLTKDKEVIIYHNFKVNITYKKKNQNELELLEIPVKDLKLAELQHMKLWHTAKPEKLDDMHKEEIDPVDLQPFPTLQQCFEGVDIHTGFQIEIKYPQFKEDGHEQDNYFDVNEFVDIILRVVFLHHRGRRIIFSSFHCDICIALRLKQNKYPVIFLTQADTKRYVEYVDIRTKSVQIAAEFSLAHGLLGVNPMSEMLFKDLSLIQYIKDRGLVLFTWGEENNDTQAIEALKGHNLDGIIYDRIDCFKNTKESIFKVEHKEKLRLVDKFTSAQNGPITVTLASVNSE